MVKLYGFGPGFGVTDPSPFVLKVETFLRMADIEYESCPDIGNLQKAPKGKLPFITDDGTTIADSDFILSYLQDKYQVNLDANLSAEEKSTSYLIGKSLDEHLYWCLLYSRWVNDDIWAQLKKEFFSSMPMPLRLIIPTLARRNALSGLQKQGLGRHSAAEVKTITQRSLQALSTVLGDKTYFFGETPSTLDATAFGFLGQFIIVSLETELNDLARSFKNLVDYCDNINAKYF